MLIFLKLGGSLITDKNTPHTPRLEAIRRLCQEIAAACLEHPELRLILGHGSGSFGHFEGKKYGTRSGVKTGAGWRGFVEVWRAARALNQIMVENLLSAGLPVLSFSPSSSITTRNREIIAWDLSPIRSALSHRVIPLVYGDVVFDEVLGGTILSTEDLFFYLSSQFKPDRIHLAGIEDGVFADFPARTQPLLEITPSNYVLLVNQIAASNSPDVTGGMAEKVKLLVKMVELVPEMQASIFSGELPGKVKDALSGSNPGTIIRA